MDVTKGAQLVYARHDMAVTVIQSGPVCSCQYAYTLLSRRPLYTQVTNNGNIDLLDATVSSAHMAHDCRKHDRLDVGQSFTCSGTRTISLPDIMKGRIDSSAT